MLSLLVRPSPLSLEMTSFGSSFFSLGDKITHESIEDLLARPHDDDPTYDCAEFPPHGYFLIRGRLSTASEFAEWLEKAEKDCTPLLKHGKTTGTTAGAYSGLCVIRQSLFKGSTRTVYALDLTAVSSGAVPFSRDGDSGSSVVDTKRKLVGLLTGGIGTPLGHDLTTFTPFHFIQERMKEVLPGWEPCPPQGASQSSA